MKASASPSWSNDAMVHLRSADQVMARIIARVGPLQISRRPERFQALVRAIIFQQLAGAAALTIYNRFVAAVGNGRFPTPEQVLAASDEVLRGAGLSRGKMSYLRDLAAHVNERKLNFHRFPKMDDEEIIVELTRVRGIGRWTAEMFLMFNLGRPDVLAVDDLGLRNAATKEYGFTAAITAKELREIGESWRPYRTAAAWYLWQSMRVVTPDAEEVRASAKPAKVPARKATIKNSAKPKKAVRPLLRVK